MRDQALFDKIDLHLIRVLHTVLTERSVSKAAIRLGMYQPAVSASLKKLRELAGDPLLVRSGAGMVPTDAGLRLFVDGLLEVGRLSSQERHDIEAKCAANGKSVPELLEAASSTLSGLSRCAGGVGRAGCDDRAAFAGVQMVAIAEGGTAAPARSGRTQVVILRTS